MAPSARRAPCISRFPASGREPGKSRSRCRIGSSSTRRSLRTRSSRRARPSWSSMSWAPTRSMSSPTPRGRSCPMPFVDIFPALQLPDLTGTTIAIGGVLLGAVVVFSLVTLFVSRYRRCPANKVLVISGKVGGGESAKCISGGGAFVWPVIQEFAYLGLEPIQIDIPLKDALSFENIRVSVPSVFTVAIGTEAEVRQNAAIRLLNLSHDQIKRQAQDIIFGQLRQVIASMKIEEINRDRDAFLHRVQQSLEPELKKIGLVLINVNITDLKDDSGYIEAIGKKAASMAVQQARGDVAEQEKLGEVRVAEAERERTVQVANAVKFREIGIREADREKAVRVAELEKEQRVGEQTAAYAREAQIKQAEREQAVRVAELDKEQQVGEQTAAFER